MSKIILTPATVIDGTGSAPLAGQAITIEGDRITQVAPVGDLSAADRTAAIDLPGKTVIPGLINNHVHLVLPGDNTPFVPWIDLQSDASLALMATHNIQTSLRAGVTTVRDCGGRREVILDVRNARAANLIDGAGIIACGWTLTITGGHTRQFGGEVDGEINLARAVREVISRGADYVKVMAAGGGTPGTFSQYPSFTESELRAIVETAHGLGKLVCAHCIATASIENAINAGVDLIEHASFYGSNLIPQIDERVAEKLAASGIPVTPTLQVNRDLVDLLDEGDERSMWQRRQETQREIVHKLQELGVPLLAGSDAGWRATAFDTFWKELDELVACGLRPVDAIHAATGAVTAALGYDDFGTILAGQRADVVVVDGDLASDIAALQQVEMVIQHGQIAHERSAQA
ncbi:MAG: amidohydrolase family protein [Thermomicrobiales bacterium]|nr:amidohydrolase family protein [Thermomicrobiales bacterium]